MGKLLAKMFARVVAPLSPKLFKLFLVNKVFKTPFLKVCIISKKIRRNNKKTLVLVIKKIIKNKEEEDSIVIFSVALPLNIESHIMFHLCPSKIERNRN